MSINENEEELLDFKEEEKEKKPRNNLPFIVVAVLIVGFALGSIFGSAYDITNWLGNSENDNLLANGFEEARPHLEQHLQQQKEQELIMEHLDDLIDASEVDINLDVIGEGDKSAAVAIVNGEEIKKEELLEYEDRERQQLAGMGIDPESDEAAAMIEESRSEILDNLITNTVLMQKVEAAGIDVDEEKIDEQYQELADQFGGEEMLEQQLAQAGMEKEDLRQQIAEQLPLQTYVENYLDEVLDEDELQFSEEELRELYEMQQQQMQQQMPGEQ